MAHRATLFALPAPPDTTAAHAGFLIAAPVDRPRWYRLGLSLAARLAPLVWCCYLSLCLLLCRSPPGVTTFSLVCFSPSGVLLLHQVFPHLRSLGFSFCLSHFRNVFDLCFSLCGLLELLPHLHLASCCRPISPSSSSIILYLSTPASTSTCIITHRKLTISRQSLVPPKLLSSRSLQYQFSYPFDPRRFPASPVFSITSLRPIQRSKLSLITIPLQSITV